MTDFHSDALVFYGATGERKHLPDMNTPSQSSTKDWMDATLF